MEKYTHLDIYMTIYLHEKKGIMSTFRLIEMADAMVGSRMTNTTFRWFTNDQPKKYEMAQWLHNEGYSQKAIAQLLEVSQPTISVYVNKKPPKVPYYSFVLGDITRDEADEIRPHLTINEYDGDILPGDIVKRQKENEKLRKMSGEVIK